MAGNLGELVVRLGIDSSGLTGGLRTAASALSGFAGSAPGLLGGVGIALVAATAITVGLGVASVKAAGDFQQSVTKLYTTAGESKNNLQMVGDGILNMSASVGTGSQKLVEAMYWIESAGLHGSQGLEALRVAAEAAKAENANLDQVSIALAASLNAYAGQGMTAVQVMNTLTAATGQGMMTFEQLSGSLKNVLPASAKFGISLKDVTAALATMTSQSDPAESAATHLRQVILALEAPSKIGAKALASVGLTSAEVAAKMKTDLPGALQMITDAVGKRFPEGSSAYNQAIKNIAGGSKQMMGFLELTGSHMKTFANNVDIIGGAVKKGGNDLMGWSDIQGNFNFKIDQAKAALEAMGIKVGTLLLPVLGKMLDLATPLITAFGNWMTSTNGLTGVFNTLGKAWQGVMTYLNGDAFAGVIADFQTLGHQLSTIVGPAFSALAANAPTLGQALQGVGTALAWIIDKVDLVVFGISQMIDFFQRNQLAADILVGVLAGVSAVLLTLAGIAFVAFLATVPALIVAFGAWAVAALAAAAATLLAAAPFILIGIVVAAVVVGIILAVQHWGQITAWLSGVWGAFSSWFMALMGSIGARFTSLWHGIQTGTSAFMGFMGNVIQDGMKALFILFFGPIIAVVNLFRWLYDHNYYFHDLIDNIRNIVQSGMNWVSNLFHSAINNIVGTWQFLWDMAVFIWEVISSTISAKMTRAWNFLVGIWNSINGTVNSASLSVLIKVGNMFITIGNIFSSAWSKYISGPLTSLGNWLKSTIDHWASIAYTSGSNFVKMIANGITSGIGWVSNAVSGIASTIWKNLGFHSPTEEGPASDSDKWMPNLIKMLSSGLNAGVPVMQKAVNQVAQPIQQLQYPIKPSASAIASAANTSPQTQASNTQGQTLIFMVDSVELARINNTTTDRLVRLKLGNRSIRAA